MRIAIWAIARDGAKEISSFVRKRRQEISKNVWNYVQ